VADHVTVERPFVSVIVPVRNGAETLADCLTSILASDYPVDRREVVVVDNGSNDGTADVAGRFPVRCVAEPRRGLSHARNRGIEEARGEILAFTDSDCTVATTWLKQLVSGFDEPHIFAVAGDVLAFPTATPAERYVALRKPSHLDWISRRGPKPYFVFGSAAVRRELFSRIGRFDPRFSVAAEDIDLVWRMARAGLEVRRQPRAVVFHKHRTTGARLFRQNRGYGRSQAALRRKYREDLPWKWRDELTAWVDLSATAWRAFRTYALGGPETRRSMSFYFPYYDFLRKLGQRVGFVEESALHRGARRRPA
jgi:GT2 family glycosyltransferase